MNWLKDHFGALGGGGGLAALLILLFKDAFREWLADWKEDRQMRRMERLQRPAGHDDSPRKDDLAMTELITLLKDDLHEQRVIGKMTSSLLERLALSCERCVDVQRVVVTQYADIDRRLTRIEGANGIK